MFMIFLRSSWYQQIRHFWTGLLFLLKKSSCVIERVPIYLITFKLFLFFYQMLHGTPFQFTASLRDIKKHDETSVVIEIDTPNSDIPVVLKPRETKVIQYKRTGVQIQATNRCLELHYLCIRLEPNIDCTFLDNDPSNNEVCRPLIPVYAGGVGQLQCPYGMLVCYT